MAALPNEITISVKLEMSNEDAGIHPTGALARMICDLVEEATQRGMEIGAKMMLDSMEDDLTEESKFPGFLGDTDESETTNG